MVYGIARNEQDAFDLAQEAFSKAWRSIDRFELKERLTFVYRRARVQRI
jgi:DNA-directed RNA polymerase specialized sigma24 family protein